MPPISAKELARRLGRNEAAIRRAIQRGTIKATRIGPHGNYLIPEHEVSRLLQQAGN